MTSRARPRLLNARQRFAAARGLANLEREVAAHERERAENLALFNRLPVNLQTGRAVLAIARSAGVRFALVGPELQFNTLGIPKRLESALTLYIFLNSRAIAAILKEEAAQ